MHLTKYTYISLYGFSLFGVLLLRSSLLLPTWLLPTTILIYVQSPTGNDRTLKTQICSRFHQEILKFRQHLIQVKYHVMSRNCIKLFIKEHLISLCNSKIQMNLMQFLFLKHQIDVFLAQGIPSAIRYNGGEINNSFLK